MKKLKKVKQKKPTPTIMKKLFSLVLKGSLFGVFVMAIGYYVLFHVLASQNPDGMFDRSTIKNALGAESVVYYNDGETLLGSFFDSEHRRYVEFKKLPPFLIDAIVASEDARFFQHSGIDPLGMMRAMMANAKAGRWVQGGSTLSQQTSKNVFGRADRNLGAKFKELLQTLRLEYHFDKDDILEFYLNQFYVVGSGRGAGIAAHYFFNKKVYELTLEECAFIAGSVKGPFNYDPFIQKTDAKLKKVLKKGKHRVAYVLGRMLKNGFIDEEEFKKALSTKLKFKEGVFRSGMQTALREVEKEMNSVAMQKLFLKNGIEQWKAAQLQIETTLDPVLQKKAHAGLRSHLSYLGVKLEGFSYPKRQRVSTMKNAASGNVFYAKIHSISKSKITLKAKYFTKTVQGKQLKKILKMLPKQTLKKGKIVYAIAVNDEDAEILYRPKIQGAVQVLKDGKVKASIGGFDNLHFNRAEEAKRQFGSSWKPLLYSLAYSLGWRYDDLLENRNNVIQYGTQFYYPNPDHKNRGSEVTVQWAATRSENIASVYLLTHLLDRVSLSSFDKILKDVGLDKATTEKQYMTFLRDKHGLILGPMSKREIQFAKAKEKIVQDLFLAGDAQQASWLKSMPLGEGFSRQMKKSKGERKEFLKHHFYFYQKHLKNLESFSLAEHTDGRIGAFASSNLPIGWSALESLPFFSLQKNVWVEGKIQIKFMRDLEKSLAETKMKKIASKDLYYLPQMKTLVAMHLFARYCKSIGITETVKPILSMVLGANDVSLASMVRAYQGIVTGKVFSMPDSTQKSSLIERIIDTEGNIIFENKNKESKVLPNNIIFQNQLGLESVVRNGTGRRSFKQVGFTTKAGFLRYPTMGKTGTTNGFKNAAFLGALANSKQDWANSWVIGAYVGYDKNKKMVTKGLRVGGSNGALPIWISAANAILQTQKEYQSVDLYDVGVQIQGGFSSHWKYPAKLKFVDSMTGVPSDSSKYEAYQWIE